VLKYLLFILITTISYGQNFALNSASDTGLLKPFSLDDDDGADENLNIGGDIFSDFNDDLESKQIQEDERFYENARLFSFALGTGITRFTGNRGRAFEDNDPTFSLSFNYFIDFQLSAVIGLQFSRHSIFIDTFVNGFRNEVVGAIDVDLLRPFIGVRYYLDTSNLGTAITYANPYITGRFEFWIQRNEFIDLDPEMTQSGGGVGFGLGVGLEFPLVIKKRYLNIELLAHSVNLFDNNTTDFQQVTDTSTLPDGQTSLFGFDDLTGLGFSFIVSYNFYF